MSNCFFDLVFVFAITQISHTLLAHFTPLGVVQTAILFLAVWWVWIYTTWITNWLDPERTPVRLMLFGLMVAGLLLSTSIPKAFESRGLAFALAFVIMQVGRSVFTYLSIPKSEPAWRMNLLRITIWLSCSGRVSGSRVDWPKAPRVLVCGPSRSPSNTQDRRCASAARDRRVVDRGDWDVEGGHLAERCAGFIIIALGESIVVTGATFSEAEWSAVVVTAFIVALIGSIAMWWIYFHLGAEAGSDRISESEESGRLARDRLHLHASADCCRHRGVGGG